MRNIIFLSSISICLLIAISCDEDLLEKDNRNKQTTSNLLQDRRLKYLPPLMAYTQYFKAIAWVVVSGSSFMTCARMKWQPVEASWKRIAIRCSLERMTQVTVCLLRCGPASYRLILRANAVIQFAPDADITDANLKARYIAEAKFLRAWTYFQLYAFWGDVPLYEEFSTTIDDAQTRAPVADVKALVISDLTEAIAALPSSYSGNDLGRATKIAAQALLAKVYLFDGQYQEAKPLLEAVIAAGESAAGGTALTDEYFDNFTEETEYNKESVWEISYTANGNYNWDGDGNDYGPNESWIRSQEYSAVGWRNLIPSDKLLAEFEDNDPQVELQFLLHWRRVWRSCIT